MLEGIVHIWMPRSIEDAYVNYIVLSLAFVFEGTTWWIAVRGIEEVKGEGGYFEAFQRSRDPASFMVLFEDSAALIGIVIAFVGTWISVQLQWPLLDGLASILIGCVLGTVAVILATETKSLLIGEPALPEVEESIKRLAAADPAIVQVNGVLTVHLAPDQILATLSLEFDDRLTTPTIEEKVEQLEARVKAAHPDRGGAVHKAAEARAISGGPSATFRSEEELRSASAHTYDLRAKWIVLHCPIERRLAVDTHQSE
jgi:divalent metal cation (Fe/Co/Zn/Cd) transporter